MIKLIGVCVSLLFFGVTTYGDDSFPETNGNEDYFQSSGPTLEHGDSPVLVNPASHQHLKGFEPVYLSPDLDDILDQQSVDVVHEEVHGTVLMPRISFGLNDDDQPIKDEDYGDYINLIKGVDPKFYGRRQGKGGGRRGGAGCDNGVNNVGGVRIYQDPMFNPTIEEMVPFGKIKDSKDTFIVMADDPVLAVDALPKCSKNTEKGGSDAGGGGGDGDGEDKGEGEGKGGGEEGGSTEASGEEGSTEGGEGGSTEEGSTEESRRRRKRAILFV